jgi:Set1/Ash2 histone methyltransferase complex subunit ASH2
VRDLRLTGLALAGVSSGKWYYEIELLSPEPSGSATLPEPHVRLGWAQKFANLQGPCGFDAFSYSWRDLEGTAFHRSRGHLVPGGGFGVGDIVGLGIQLPAAASTPAQPFPPGFRQGEKAVLYKNNVYFEERVTPVETAPVAGTAIQGFVNGVPHGALFNDLLQGEYFAAVSLYMNARVRVNFGPSFRFPPPAELGFRPYCEALHLNHAYNTAYEVLDAVERLLAPPPPSVSESGLSAVEGSGAPGDMLTHLDDE